MKSERIKIYNHYQMGKEYHTNDSSFDHPNPGFNNKDDLTKGKLIQVNP